jgi:hypothetical protein
VRPASDLTRAACGRACCICARLSALLRQHLTGYRVVATAPPHVIRHGKAKTSERLLFLQGGLEAKAHRRRDRSDLVRQAPAAPEG